MNFRHTIDPAKPRRRDTVPTHETANLDALTDLCTPWCIHVVATLRIADHIAAGVVDLKASQPAAAARRTRCIGC
jgi:hypothetical protein